VVSDIAGKSYGRQLDALTTLGVRPTAYLLRAILYAMLLATPLLVAIGYFAAQFVSVAVFTTTHPELGPEFWDAHFHRGLRMPGQWLYIGTSWLLAKTLICAAGIALIAYFTGKGPKHSSREVSGAITSTILWSTLLVLVVHFAFAFWEF
jgi:ABC-type transporter Mla maintaining outer membrane lipid asymmetry permease subunit MlaE